MEFNGEFELDGVTNDEVWVVLSDPIAVQRALPGCEYLTEVENEDVEFDADESADRPPIPAADPETVAQRTFEQGETYAALMDVSIGPVNPSFDVMITIDTHDCPRMEASGSGDSSSGGFTLDAWMEIEEFDDGMRVNWGTTTHVTGRIAQMGQRMMNPVAQRLVNNFFDDIESQMHALKAEGEQEMVKQTRELM